MKLRIAGSVNERGNYVPFESVHADLPSLVGQPFALAVRDTRLQINEVGPRFIRFSFIRFDKRDELCLYIGQAYAFSHKGNAYEYQLSFALEE